MYSGNPLIFEPLPVKRVWGGGKLNAYGKVIPYGTSVGELWEVVDRREAQSVVRYGLLKGETLNALWQGHREEIFGAHLVNSPSPRFPILCKLLDVRECLSVQVHPPERVAKALNGESKTEVWYFLETASGAKVYAGLKKGTSKRSFELLLAMGHIEEALHKLPVETGNSLFIPSGRLHAARGGVIVEIQQNSDTTFRLYDWDRRGLDGLPRRLHIHESLASINFLDFEPRLQPSGQAVIASCPFFHVDFLEIARPMQAHYEKKFSIYVVVKGSISCGGSSFTAGQFFFVPAQASEISILPIVGGSCVLKTTLP
ncbi:MAG: class I mannose-6-phosphate isomerase [Candidatus Xiphinematobacter sp.]|nr:MAG: class I mannose-6-phosphate isomerase [Candidatus Xiphinematobacter sp.]